MPRHFKKLIAILLAVWIPLFGGNALAASISMQHGPCHHAAMTAGEHMDQNATDSHDESCSSACHLACCGYLAVEQIPPSTPRQTGNLATPYLFSFHSITSIPLLPPPLA